MSVSLYVCVWECLCMCVEYCPYNNQTVFTKIGKMRKYLRLSSLSPHLAAGAQLSYQRRLCIFHNVHEHVLDPLSLFPSPLHHDIPLLLHVSEFLAMYVGCVVRCVLCKTWAASHVSISTSCGGNSCHFPLATHCPLPSPCCLLYATDCQFTRLQQVPIKMLSIFALLTFQSSAEHGKCPDKCCRYSVSLWHLLRPTGTHA